MVWTMTRDDDIARGRCAAGLCDECHYARTIVSARQSVFYLCERSAMDASFVKYPRLPVRACAGYVKRERSTS